MKLIAYPVHLNHPNPMPIVPARVDRGWMDDTPNHFAYRCLPLTVANQAGWWVMNTHKVHVSWTGGPDIRDLTIRLFAGGHPCPISSHFGCGIVTFTLPYLFRTEPGYDLHVRGPANWPKDGIAALEGLVEADKAHQTFTMNWRMTRPGTAVFMQDEPICQILPVRRGALELVEPTIEAMPADVRELNRKWSQSRDAFNIGLHHRDPASSKKGWQKDYFHAADVHKLDLRPFREVPNDELRLSTSRDHAEL